MMATNQNSEGALILMRARQRVWLIAKRVLLLQFGLTVIGMLGIAAFNLFFPAFRHYTATIALLIALLDVAILDRWQKSLLKTAAKIAEEFDTFVLGIPWNDFVVGNRVSPEVIQSASNAYRRHNSDDKIKDWYPSEFSDLPVHVGRVLCQRTNLWYDAKLRWQYSFVVAALAAVVAMTGTVLAWHGEMVFPEVVVSLLVPATPLFLWCIREFLRHIDTARSQDLIRQSAEKIWLKAANPAHNAADVEVVTRQFQDAIYARRSGSPLIFPGIYSILRPKFEVQMKAAAQTLMHQYLMAKEPAN